MSEKPNFMFGLGFAVMIILLTILSPMITITALNVLFNANIPITIWTWLATAWLHLLLGRHFTTIPKEISK